MKRSMPWLIVCLLSWSGLVLASEQPATGVDYDGRQITNLDELLNAVRETRRQEKQLQQRREREFLNARNRQKALLEQAKRDFRIAQKDNNPLQKITELNAAEIKKLKQQLETRKQEMGDVYSIFNEFSGDLATVLNGSMTAVEFPDRSEQLQQLANRERLASITDMENLWLLLQEDMTATAKIKPLTVPVVATDGMTEMAAVTRAGAFTAFSNGRFLRYIPEVGELLALERQPAGRFQAAIADYEEAAAGELTRITVDPSGGSLLGLLSYTPDLRERIEQGGLVGMIILGLGALGVAITLWRLGYLSWVYNKIRRQQRNIHQPSDNNPLGRVILQAQQHSEGALQQSDKGEALQYTLDEAVLVEVPSLERGHNFIKLLAAISPLLGLLGTVTGMILTFQAISLFGSGDPKLMASGISQALVTTVLGLVVAIPLLFGHSLVSSLSRNMIQRLDEQSAGLMAEHMGADDNILPR
ncbi:MAG: MotA/TolQ/ExbB proton channel family protein [Candidatus Pelagadaptatus aseana]|uniref:MotA/TolQ/ExbB proton channel family protein n=1 Tax=Candidatus Pelagadaptatus aseana TaxID=3120508 RepID=UPI0039B31C3B